jgi:hypothetical protein
METAKSTKGTFPRDLSHLTVAETASFLGVTSRTIRYWMEEKQMPGSGVTNGITTFDWSVVLEWYVFTPMALDLVKKSTSSNPAKSCPHCGH